jgi:predicted metal-dependent hydrolase
MPEPRYAPDISLPPYSYVPGHGLPHPVNDPAGHLYAQASQAHELPITSSQLSTLPSDLVSRRRALAAALATNSRWLYALDLFNAGFYWEAHEAWESFWNAFGRTTPEAQFVQGLIHLAAACVKVREGKPMGVSRHTKRARELLGELEAANPGGTLKLAPESLAAVVAELEKYTPACWHTSKTPVVRVLAGNLRLAG